MSSSLQFWLFGLGSLLTGAFISWLFMRNKVKDLLNDLSLKSDKILLLENDYAGLRASSQEQILALKEEKQGLQYSGRDEDLNKKYDKLKVEYNSLQSKVHQFEHKELFVTESNAVENTSKSTKKINDLKSQITQLEEKNLGQKKLKGELKTSKKTIRKLKKDIEILKSEIKKVNGSKPIEKRVEITKSLRTKKLINWLSRDKAYKIRKKVSTNRLKD